MYKANFGEGVFSAVRHSPPSLIYHPFLLSLTFPRFSSHPLPPLFLSPPFRLSRVKLSCINPLPPVPSYCFRPLSISLFSFVSSFRFSFPTFPLPIVFQPPSSFPFLSATPTMSVTTAASILGTVPWPLRCPRILGFPIIAKIWPAKSRSIILPLAFGRQFAGACLNHPLFLTFFCIRQ